MMIRIPITSAALLLLAIPLAAGETHKLNWESRIAGADSITALAADGAGNVYATGAASEALPLVNSVRRSNSGTDISVSDDGGVTWKGLTNLPTGRPGALAAVPSTPGTFIMSASDGIYRSTDNGATWLRIFSGTPFPPYNPVTTAPGSIVFEPDDPKTIYICGESFGILKTIDAGAHWTLVNTGLPMDGAGSAHIGYLAIDPFHPRTLIAGLGSKAYRSEDGALSWRNIDLMVPNGSYRSSDYPLVAFDPKLENVLYSFAWFSLFRSPDGGATWVRLAVPGSNVNTAVPDPGTAGVIYASSELGVFKSTDGGATWTNIGPPEAATSDVVRMISVDPSNPARIMMFASKDSWSTTNGGASWTRMKLSRRAYAAAFGSKGRVVATAARSIDAFLVKRDAAGETALSCLLGGQGDDQTQALAVDGAGNLYVAGTTTSEDLDVGENAAQRAFGGGQSDAFVAKIASDGKLIWATYLGGTGTDRASAIAIAPDGSVAVAGYTASPDFAPASGTPPQFVGQTFVARIAADGSRVLSVGRVGGWAGHDLGGMALDASGNVWVAGTSGVADLPVTSGAIKPTFAGYADGFLAKVAPDGTLLYATYLGGDDWDKAAGVAVDSEGNVYVAGSTRSKDFTTTEGAFHRELCSDCPYPSSCIATGIIGTICSYVGDDIFAMKLTPDGKKVLWSTLIGGGCFEEALGVAVGADASVYILGNSNSSPFPAKYPIESGPLYSAYKPVILRLDATGGALMFGSNIGVGSVQTLSPDGLWYVGGAGGRVSQLVPAEPPAISLDAIQNAFRLTGGPVAPGELLRLTAPDLHPAEAGEYYLSPATPLPTEIGQTRVLFDGRAVPLMAALNGTAVVTAPFSLTPGTTVTVQIDSAGVQSNAVRMDVVSNDVGMLSADGSGRGQAYAQNADGRMNAPDNPASAGDLITVFFTGAGATTPASTEGVAAPNPAPGIAAIINVTIGSYGVRVEEAGTIPGFLTGLSYARVRVPNFPYGSAGVKIKVSVWNADNSGFSSSQELNLSVR
jgi:uncharacterized protein (TIGR03437 family)